MTTRSLDDIYGNVNALKDIREINRQIRHQMAGVRGQEQLTELKKRSDYLCTLTYAPTWQKRFGSKSRRFLEVAKEEEKKTTGKANTIAHRKGFDVQYHPWQGG